MKRSFRLFLLPILVGSAGCTTVDNNVGTLANDSGVADGPGQGARDVQVQPADASILADAAVPPDVSTSPEAGSLGIGRPCDLLTNPGPSQAAYNPQASECPSRVCLKPEDQVGGVDTGPFCTAECSADSDCVGQTRDPSDPTDKRCAGGYTCGVAFTLGPLTCQKLCLCKDFLARSPNVPTGCSSTMPDAAVPDAVSVGKDAAPDAADGGAVHQCQANGATCTAITPNTACTPFTGRLYDEAAGCYSAVDTTLGCCATAAGEACALPTASGCYQSTVVDTIAYWTPNLATAAVTLIHGGAPCAQPTYAKVGSANPCGPAVVDAAPASPEASAAHQCQVNTDGTCAAVTPNTACTPYRARRYDESAVCLAAAWTTLWCCATAAGDSCGWPGTTGCLQVTTDAGGVTYWTPAAAPSSPPIPGGELCDQSKSAKVASTEGSLCPATPPDAGARSDAEAAIMTPTLPAACTTDADCCVAMDGCMATGYLVGKAEYSSMVASIAKVNSGGRMCLACIQPAVQVRCQGGFCAGDEILTSASPASLRTSHCGLVADASGAPAVSPHAPVDAGTSGSSPSAWGCGVN